MFKKIACLSLLLQLLLPSAYAQKNLKGAVVIFNNSTDTAKGFIDYKEWLTNPSSILFTTGNNVTTRRLGFSDITYFEIINLDEQYRRYTVKISMDEVTTGNLGERDTSSETKEVFLKILVIGKNVSLYSYRDKLKTRYYLQDGNNLPFELLNTTYLENNQVKQESQYRINLQNLAAKYLPGESDITFKINSAGDYASDMGCKKTGIIVNRGSFIVTKTRALKIA